MLEFTSLAELAHHLALDSVGGLANTKRGLAAAAELLEREAKAEFGEYQEGAGPFGSWPELAEATKADRVAKGFPENEPLLRTGDLRDSIEHECEDWDATVGSTSPIMPYMEFGTSRGVPPRPVLGIALWRNIDKIRGLIGDAAVSGFAGGKRLPPEAGYEPSSPSPEEG